MGDGSSMGPEREVEMSRSLDLDRVRRWLLAAAAVVVAGCGTSSQSSRTCTEEQCGEFGSCLELDGGAVCACDEGYSGADCSDCDDGFVKAGSRCVVDREALGEQLCEDDPCNGNGTCDGTSGEVQCECDEGYTGDDCSECASGYHEDGDACVADETCEDGSCPENASCDDTGGVVTCECNEGWDGDDCDSCAAGYHEEDGDCVEDTECGPNTCPNGTCDDSSGVPVCTCNPGFAGEHCDECDEGYHEDGDECVLDEVCGDDSCPANATCDDTGGVIVCTCVEGYTGDACDECEAPLMIDATGACVEPCASGLVMGEDGQCVLECDEEHTLVDVAGINPNQIPIPDGYELQPPATIVFPDGGTLTLRYAGTQVCVPLGYTCDQYDPCGGSTWGYCEDQSGLPVCICDTGYTGFSCNDCDDGYHADGAECLVDEVCAPDSCSNAGTCDDSTGQLDCTCNPGFGGEDCGACAPGFHRDDQGACVEDEVCGDCNGHGTCRVVEGLAQCTCFIGYAGEDCGDCEGGYHEELGACLKDTICTGTTCSGHGICTEVDGDTVCDPCDAGYDGPNCGECADDYTRANGVCVPLPDPNSCTPNPCNGGTCDDSSGSISCSCQFPYTGSRCQSCVTGYVKWPDGICRASSCGDGIRDVRGGEECDPGDTTVGDCPYGQTSCEVCGGPAPNNASPTGPYDPANHCQVVPGIAHFCGNGVAEAQEACDDGARSDGCTVDANGNMSGCAVDNADACLANCVANVCGDTFVNPATEECDNGVNNAVYGQAGGCAAGCVDAPYCGDSTINGNEQCDDGNTVNTDECRNTCQTNVCGDGVVLFPNGTEVGSNCDQGANNTPYCPDDECDVCLPAACAQDSCTIAVGLPQYCGDGVINGDEECDDVEPTCPELDPVSVAGEPPEPDACCNADCRVEGTSICGDDYCHPDERSSSDEGCLADCLCGNGICDDDEEYDCPADCATCCDGICSEGEANPQAAAYCPFDCYCGDGVCSGAESNSDSDDYCPADCGICGDGLVTGDEECDDGSGGSCFIISVASEPVSVLGQPPPDLCCHFDCTLGTCGDDFCDLGGGEDFNSCPTDCGVCGDENCNPFGGENCGSCPEDCFSCPG